MTGKIPFMEFVKNWNRAKDELPTLHGSPPAAKLLLPFLQASFPGVERNMYTIMKNMKMIKAIHDAIHKTGL